MRRVAHVALLLACALGVVGTAVPVDAAPPLPDPSTVEGPVVLHRVSSPDSISGPFRWTGYILAPNFRGSVSVDVSAECYQEDGSIYCDHMRGSWLLKRLDGSILHGTMSAGPLSSWPDFTRLHARFDLSIAGGWGAFAGATGGGTLEGDFLQGTHTTDPYFPAFNGEIALALD